MRIEAKVLNRTEIPSDVGKQTKIYNKDGAGHKLISSAIGDVRQRPNGEFVAHAIVRPASSERVIKVVELIHTSPSDKPEEVQADLTNRVRELARRKDGSAETVTVKAPRRLLPGRTKIGTIQKGFSNFVDAEAGTVTGITAFTPRLKDKKLPKLSARRLRMHVNGAGFDGAEARAETVKTELENEMRQVYARRERTSTPKRRPVNGNSSGDGEIRITRTTWRENGKREKMTLVPELAGASVGHGDLPEEIVILRAPEDSRRQYRRKVRKSIADLELQIQGRDAQREAKRKEKHKVTREEKKLRNDPEARGAELEAARLARDPDSVQTGLTGLRRGVVKPDAKRGYDEDRGRAIRDGKKDRLAKPKAIAGGVTLGVVNTGALTVGLITLGFPWGLAVEVPLLLVNVPVGKWLNKKIQEGWPRKARMTAKGLSQLTREKENEQRHLAVDAIDTNDDSEN